MAAIVLYYSRAGENYFSGAIRPLAKGNTETVAEEIARLTGAELFRTSLTGMDLTSCTLDRIVLSETCRELKGALINAAQAAVVARILGIRVEG